MTLLDLEKRKTRMIDYLQLKVQEADWHGVADAAMDLREIEAQQKLLSEPRLSERYHDVESNRTVAATGYLGDSIRPVRQDICPGCGQGRLAIGGAGCAAGFHRSRGVHAG